MSTMPERSFNQKIRYSLINDRNPLKVLCTDKIKCKEYIKDKLNSGNFTPKTFEIADTYSDISKKISQNLDHPSDFLLKSNNDSGGRIFVKNNLVDPNKVNLLEKYKDTPYGQNKGEWFYKDIKYKCFSEEIIGENLIDYKFHCSNGKPRFCQVIWDRFSTSKTKEVSVSLDGETLFDFHICIRFNLVKKFVKPKNWQKMIEIAEKLCQDFDYVRVDIYNVNVEDYTEKSIFIGELTFAPAAGRYPGEGQIEAGKLLLGI